MFARRKVYQRLNFLLPELEEQQIVEETTQLELTSALELYLHQADIKVSAKLFSPIIFALGLSICLVISKFIGLVFLPVVFFGYCFLIYLMLEKRVENRSHLFSIDYPTVLMATASSVKAGLTPYAALERSVNLLPKDSLVRTEVAKLLQDIRRGHSRRQAIDGFGLTIRQPDLELFREAFLIVLEHGGRFAPTLERLALVCRDRSSLIRSAKVSTASMRMTANVLLIVTPLVVALVALRTKNFWDTFFNNPIANSLGSTGLIVILLSYGLLIKMSSFKA